ncbi:dTDP-glucose 4,6-dehydratase [Microgenomates group bacterium]|nr:dTDP-glucose 4,6-dehydratase [Microgenomates group bacterium]
MKLLVTGGCGFIGSNFILHWLSRHSDDEIYNLDALTYAGDIHNLDEIKDHPHYHFIHGDIRDRDLVDKTMVGMDMVVHFAAESHVDRSIASPQIFLATNVLGTQNLLDAALTHKVPRFHHISTDEVFGSLELGSSAKFQLHTPYDPRSPYSASKAASDHLVRAYGETYGLPYTISNCSNNYGRFQFPEKLIGLAITNLLEGKKIPVYGDGLNVRDWLFVEDHCRAIADILERGELGQTYLIGGLKDDISNLDLVRQICQLMDKDPNSSIEFVTDRLGHDRRYAVDWSFIHDQLGWEPSVTLAEGLQKTIDFYVNNESWWRSKKT